VVGLVLAMSAGGCVRTRTSIEKPVPLAGPLEVQSGERALRVAGDVTTQTSIATPLKLETPLRIEGPIVIELRAPTIPASGILVTEALYDRIRLKETTGEWLLAVLGEPTNRATLSTGEEVWKWEYRPEGQSSPLVRILGGGGDKEPKPQPLSTIMILRDGVVVEKLRG